MVEIYATIIVRAGVVRHGVAAAGIEAYTKKIVRAGVAFQYAIDATVERNTFIVSAAVVDVTIPDDEMQIRILYLNAG